MRLGILETLHAPVKETLYPSRSLTAGSGNSDTAGAKGVELTATAVILTGAQPTPRRRQVIIVTHNANLVINTDADQIILAEVGTASAGAAADPLPIGRSG